MIIATGTVGTILAALCCTPLLLALMLGALGLSAWLVAVDYVVISALIVSLVLVVVGLYRRRITA